jgi:hypothetical protein
MDGGPETRQQNRWQGIMGAAKATAVGYEYLTSDLQLLGSAEVCRLLGVSRGWLNDHATGRRRPVISSVQMGKLRRFREKDIADFIEECRRLGQAKPMRGHRA